MCLAQGRHKSAAGPQSVEVNHANVILCDARDRHCGRRQAAYLKFVSDNRQKLGRPAGPTAVPKADNDPVAKDFAENFLRRSAVSKWAKDLPRTGDVWTDLAAYYTKVRDQTQDTSVQRKDKTTVSRPVVGYVNGVCEE